MCHHGPGCQGIQKISWVHLVPVPSLKSVWPLSWQAGLPVSKSSTHLSQLCSDKDDSIHCLVNLMAFNFLPRDYVLFAFKWCKQASGYDSLYSCQKQDLQLSRVRTNSSPGALKRSWGPPVSTADASEQLQGANQPSPEAKGRLMTEHPLTREASPLQRRPDKIKVRSQRATLMEVHLWLYSQWWWVTPGQPSTVCNVPSGCFTTGWEGSPVWIGTDLSTVGKEWHFQTVSLPHSILYTCGCLAIWTG